MCAKAPYLTRSRNGAQRAAEASAAILIVAVLGGCAGDGAQSQSVLTESGHSASPSEPSHSPTAEETERKAKMIVSEFLAKLPRSTVAGVEQIEPEHVITCPSGGHAWHETTRIFITGSPDFEKVRLSVQIALTLKGSYLIEFQPATDFVMPGLDIRDPYGSRHMAAPNLEGTHYDVLSFSPCTDMPGLQPPRGTV